jgi:hypothetical protein
MIDIKKKSACSGIGVDEQALHYLLRQAVV